MEDEKEAIRKRTLSIVIGCEIGEIEKIDNYEFEINYIRYTIVDDNENTELFDEEIDSMIEYNMDGVKPAIDVNALKHHYNINSSYESLSGKTFVKELEICGYKFEVFEE